MKTVEKLDYETNKLALELEAKKRELGGEIPAEKKPEFERSLQDRYVDMTKDYRLKLDSYRQLMTSSPTGTAAHTIATTFIKILDPTSVISLNEFKAFEDKLRSLGGKMTAGLRKAWYGEPLSDDEQMEIQAEAGRIINQAARRDTEVRSGLKAVTQNYKLNEENVFVFPEHEKVPESVGLLKKQRAEAKRKTPLASPEPSQASTVPIPSPPAVTAASPGAKKYSKYDNYEGK